MAVDLKADDRRPQRLEEMEVLAEMAEQDSEFAQEFVRELGLLEEDLRRVETQALLSGPMDDRNAILTIHARDGGVDANDWAEMLLRMYINWAHNHDYEVEILDRQDNEQAGITSATIAVRGPFAYGYLKGETGIHRLVRISPFNAEGKRQTSFAAVDVSPEVEEQVDIQIDWDKDVREDVFRSGGSWGPTCQQNLQRCSIDPPAHRHRSDVPKRAESASEPCYRRGRCCWLG